jgi:serine/threonine-protein kinase
MPNIDLVGQRLGQFEIISRYGEGGMATVYRARQLNVDRDVALKVIEPKLAQKDVFNRRFEQESKLVAQLSHPHIVKLFDYGIMRGYHLRLINSQFDPKTDIYYYAMELLTGGSLASKIMKGPLPPAQVGAILNQIGPALDFAHAKGVIHRDLKPANILFDGMGNAFLTDFGIAKLIRESAETNSLTQEGTTVGTPSYMAPEQWQGENIGPWTDIYSLGVMVYEMLTGKLPFVAGTPYRLLTMHMNDQPPSLHKTNPDLPAGLDDIIAKAMAKKAKDRYMSATALAQAFSQALNAPAPVTVKKPAPASGDPDQTVPASHADRSARAAASSALNNRRLLILIAVALIILIVLVLALLLVTATLPRASGLPEHLLNLLNRLA